MSDSQETLDSEKLVFIKGAVEYEIERYGFDYSEEEDDDDVEEGY